MDVVYENGKEDYRNSTINGKPTKKPLEEVGGAWSTGEFGTILINLFAPDTAADFHYTRDSRIAGINWPRSIRSRSCASTRTGPCTPAPRPTCPPTMEPSGSTRRPRACCASRWKPTAFPEGFPTDHVESATDYQYVRLGDASSTCCRFMRRF